MMSYAVLGAATPLLLKYHRSEKQRQQWKRLIETSNIKNKAFRGLKGQILRTLALKHVK